MGLQSSGSDEETEQGRRKRRDFYLYIGAIVIVMASEVLFIVLLALWSPNVLSRFFPYITAVGGWAVILIPAFLVWFIKRSDPIGETLSAGGTDELQGRLVRPFIWFPVAVALNAYPITRISLQLIDGGLGSVRYSASSGVLLFLLLGVGFSAALAGKGIYRKYRGVLDDELFLKNRATGIQTGFYAAIAAMVIAYFVGLYDPAWGIAILPTLCGAAIATAGLRFVFLDWKAGLDG